MSTPHLALDDSDDTRDQVVLMRDVPWSVYTRLADARRDKAVPRFYYLDGELEIVSPGLTHEGDKKLIARLLEIYAFARGIPLTGHGSTTYRNKPKRGGLEPDECYYVGKVKGFPHIAIEVVKSSAGVDKLEIYRRLGVREVWYWAKGAFQIFELGSDQSYRTRSASGVLPELDLDHLAEVVRSTKLDDDQTQVVRRYWEQLQAHSPVG